MNRIYLAGGGDSDASKELDIRFIQDQTKRLLYIPVALEGNKKHPYPECYKWITTTFSKIKNHEDLEIQMITNLEDISVEYLRGFDAIYIGGGNTYKLLQIIKDSGSDKLLKTFIKDYGPIYGGSAGAIILGKNIQTVSEENDKEYQYSDGLNLLKGLSIRCHFKDTPEEVRKINLFLGKYGEGVLALPEDGKVIIEGDSMEILGKSPVYYFSRKENPFIIKRGELIKVDSY